MTLWHVPLAKDDLDGYYVVADNTEDAFAKVSRYRDDEFGKVWAEPDHQWPTGFSKEQCRRWYFTGIYYTHETPDPDVQLAEPVAIEGGVVSIPFLGYQW